MTRRLAVVFEAAVDFQTATELADRALLNEIQWLDHSLLESQRIWLGNESRENRLSWKSIRELATKFAIRVHGKFGGESGSADAHAARRAIRVARRLFSELDGILLIRDQDDQPERRHGLEQARAEAPTGLVVVIGLAICKREAWVLAGFAAETAGEHEAFAAERQTLGFDPCARSHELTAKHNEDTRSAKRVLKVLANGDVERERRCWRDTSLARLRDCGAENGLSDYLDEIRDRFVPLFK